MYEGEENEFFWATEFFDWSDHFFIQKKLNRYFKASLSDQSTSAILFDLWVWITLKFTQECNILEIKDAFSWIFFPIKILLR